MEDFKKKFCGTWKFDRSENLEEGMKAMGTPEEDIKFFASVKPTMVIDLEGDTVSHRNELAPGIHDDLKYKFGEEFVNKDPNNDPPMYHNKILATIEKGVVKCITRSLLTGPRKKDYQTNLTVNGDEMCSETGKIGDRSIVMKMYYKRA